MLSRSQIILLQRAKREAALPDDEYRDALETVTGQRTSKAPTLTDRHLDLLLAYLEAIHFRKVDAGELQPACRSDAVFRQRGYWAAKNTRAENSRDRFTRTAVEQEITRLEAEMAGFGFGAGYCQAIRQKSTHGRSDGRTLLFYKAALLRTLAANRRGLSQSACA